MQTLHILERLIAFDTVSHRSNLALMDYLRGLLSDHGIDCTLLPNATGSKANLYASVGPASGHGVLLSGHTDVVPVAHQHWSRPPFEMTTSDGRHYGRGTTDMKGFVAAATHAAIRASKEPLRTPLHLAFSYDEELGCLGVHSLIDLLAGMSVKPAMCIVGEPTSLEVATTHKGKIAFRVRCTGREAHSALAPGALNAIHLAVDLIQAMRRMQAAIIARCPEPMRSTIPYTTLHVGIIKAGTTLNIVPGLCEFDAEIRSAPDDDEEALFGELETAARHIVAGVSTEFPDADISFDSLYRYPGLDTPRDAQVVEFVQSLSGANDTISVAFGTEGGLFSNQLAIPTVICGPGSMEQGHKPDEFIESDQLDRCDAMLERLIGRLVSGL